MPASINTVLNLYGTYHTLITAVSAQNQWTLPPCDNIYLIELSEINEAERQIYLENLNNLGISLDEVEISMASYLQNLIYLGETDNLNEQLPNDLHFRLRNNQYAYLKLAIWQGNLPIIRAIIDIVEYIDERSRFVMPREGINPFTGMDYDLEAYEEDYDENDSENSEDEIEDNNLDDAYFQLSGATCPPEFYIEEESTTFMYTLFQDAEFLTIASRETFNQANNLEIIDFLINNYNRIEPEWGIKTAISSFSRNDAQNPFSPQYWSIRFAIRNNDSEVVEKLVVELGIFGDLHTLLHSDKMLENNEPLGAYLLQYVQQLRKQKAEIAIMLQFASDQDDDDELEENSLKSMLNFYQEEQGIEYLEQISNIIEAEGEGQGNSLENCIRYRSSETIDCLNNAINEKLSALRENFLLPLQMQPIPAGLAQAGFFANNNPNNAIGNDDYRDDATSTISSTID